MDCRSFKELVPALALDALDEAERAACTAHLAEHGPHAGCAEALSDARALAARLARALPERSVDPRVWRAIEDRAQAETAARRADEHALANNNANDNANADADGKDGTDDRPPRRREPAGWGVAVILLGMYLARNPEQVTSALTSATFGFGLRSRTHATARVI
jgi:hypothetical protein